MAKQWLNISKARKGLRRWWTILGGLLLLLILLQTILGQYQDMEALAWLWLGLNLLPGWLIVYLGAWLQPYPHKLVALESAKALKLLSIVYLLLLLVTIILSQAAIDNSDWGLDSYLQKSLLWTSPINLLVILGLGIFYFHKKSLRRPGAEAIREIAQKQSTEAEKEYPLRSSILTALAANEPLKAMQELNSYFKNKKERDEVIVLQGEHHALQKQERMNLIDPQEAQRTHNRILWALVQLCNAVEV